jgi:4-hydroxybenzoate polyprenyltransferase
MATATLETTTRRPLVVDLDGTFFKTDVLWESILQGLKSDHRRLIQSFSHLVRGKAAFKHHLIDHVTLDLDGFPVAQEIVEFIRCQKAAGHPIILATGSTAKVARAVAELYPYFDEVWGTEIVNLSGRNKGTELEKRFGKGGFDYIGNAYVDLKVWTHCHTAYYYNTNWVTRLLLRWSHPRAVAIEKSHWTPLSGLIKAMRPHQWSKNLLIPLPFMAAHRAFTSSAVIQMGRGFLAFCLTASAVYLINDMFDLEHDRRHPSKKARPLAAGHVSIPSAIGTVLLLLSVTVLLAQGLPLNFIGLLGGYLVLTSLYSLWLKRRVLMDVITLAVLYVWRLMAGGALMDVPLSRWFAVFSVFFFFSLALVKRCSELVNARARGIDQASGRGYQVSDLPLISQFGTVSGMLAALVYCLYVASPEVTRLYHKPEWLWMVLPVLIFWICRIWLLAWRGKVQEDPILYTFKDPYSYGVGVLMAAAIIAAI